MSFEGIKDIPTVGWIFLFIAIFFIFIIAIGIVASIFYLFIHKNIKTKLFEVENLPKQQQKEMYIAEGKDQLENQCQVAKQLIKKLRIKLYSTGLDIFDIKEKKDLEIFELITYRISDRLNYDVRNDLTRNHITKKTDEELSEYSNAKAKGYYYMIYDRLYNMNSRLPEFDLPKIIELIPEQEINNIFNEIYFSARDIAGGVK